MCSEGDKTVSQTEQSQAAFQQELTKDFSTAFGKNQEILNFLNTTLTNAIKNPQGFSQPALTAMRTGATDAVSKQFQDATVAANATAAAHGGAALPSGVAAQVSGQIAQGAAAEQSKQQQQITLANEQEKQNNYWKAIAGLGGVASQENPNAYASNATSAANSVSNLGQTLLATQQADWQNAGAIISGVAGLGEAVATGGMSIAANQAAHVAGAEAGSPASSWG